MARFIGYLQGCRGGVSRLGSKGSGVKAQARGWGVGGRVDVYYDKKLKEDVVEFHLDYGSGGGGDGRDVGRFTRKDLDKLNGIERGE